MHSVKNQAWAFSGLLTLSVAFVIGTGQSASAGMTSAPLAARAAVSAMPLSFERNMGQAATDVQYLAQGSAYSIALSAQGAALYLTPAGSPGSHAAEVIRLEVRGATGSKAPSAEAPLPGRINYVIGNDPARWLTNLRTYAKVRYSNVYSGVDLVYYGTAGKLEYDFAVAPHASARPMSLSFVGADSLRLDSRGALQVGKGDHRLTFEPPVAYQMAAGRRVPVAASYRIEGDLIRFKLGAYDHSRTLIVDPVLSYLSYLGGSSNDTIGSGSPQGGIYANGFIGTQGAAIDSAGDLYVAGYTASLNFPTQSPIGPIPTKTAGNTWAFVTKIAPDAKSLVFSTYLGGTNGNDYGYGIAVDASGNAFVVGQTGSSNFPATNGAYLTICGPAYVNSPNNPYSNCGPGGDNESFVAKLSPAGALLAATFLGGTGTDSAAGAVAVDTQGRPYVVGTTFPGETIPTPVGGLNEQVGFQTTTGAILAAYPYISGVAINGYLQYDAYVSVFDPTLATLLYSTLFGDDRPQNGTVSFISQSSTHGTAIAVDASGNFYITGSTGDNYLPLTAGAYETNPASCGYVASDSGTTSFGGACGYVAKFSAIGTNPPSLVYATYLGGQATAATQGHSNWDDDPSGIVADSSGNAYVLGYANEAGFPTTTGAYQTTCDGYDNATSTGDFDCSSIFVAKLNPTGTTLLASTYLGCATCSGDGISTVGAIALDSKNNVYVSGFGDNGLPVVNGFASTDTDGVGPYVAELNPTLSTLNFSTFVNVGTAGQIAVSGLAVDTSGAIYVAGSVNSPTSSAATSGVFQAAYGGGSSDGFVAKVIVTEATKTTLSISPTSTTTGTTVTFTGTVAETSGAAVPTGTVTFSNGATKLGSGTLNSSGVATYVTSSLAAGKYTVTAAYGGDASNNPSTSSAVNLTVTTPPAPTVTISVAPTSITQGGTAALTWSSTNASSCSASGAWSGAQATSGSANETPTSTGSLTYTLTCTGAGGTANKSATLTVTASSSSGGGGGGGGGAFDLWTLLALGLVMAGGRALRQGPCASASP